MSLFSFDTPISQLILFIFDIMNELSKIIAL